MDELAELPFKKVLSYLSLEDLLKSRGVSRSWLNTIDSFKMKTLCYSSHPKGFIYEKNRFVSDAFSRNFIASTQFESFFKTFSQTILSHLKHLRLYGLDLNTENRMAAFSHALNSFEELEELDLLYFYRRNPKVPKVPNLSNQPIPKKRKLEMNLPPLLTRRLELNLPMLKRIQLKRVKSIDFLTLRAPMLKKVQVHDCDRLKVMFWHGESVEWLYTSWMSTMRVEALKNLKTIYIEHSSLIRPLFDFPSLFGLKHLKAIHLNYYYDFEKKLFDQMQRHGRADLQVYCFGYLVDGANDPLLSSIDPLNEKYGRNFFYLPANHSRLADEIPFWSYLNYCTAIEHLSAESQAAILDRLTDLGGLCIDRPVQDIECFLRFLKTFNHKSQFENLLFYTVQPQTLFDRLPEHCTVQKLTLYRSPSNFKFLFRMKHLVELELFHTIGPRLIRKALKELEFLQVLLLKRLDRDDRPLNLHVWKVRKSVESPKRFKVHFCATKFLDTCDLSAVIQFIEENIINLYRDK